MKVLKKSHYSFILTLTILLFIPLIWNPKTHPFLINTLIWTFFYAYLASSWNILAGYCGQYSFGHAAFVGLGAYTNALLYISYGVSPWISMAVGALISAAVSLLISLPSLRLKGHYFILITLALCEVLRMAFLNFRQFTQGASGLTYPVKDFSIPDFQFNVDRTPYYYIAIIMLLTALLIVYKLKASRWGYYFMAIREDEILADFSGINIVKYKVLATIISAILTSLAGAFYAQFVLYIDPYSVFNLSMMLKTILITVLGGIGTLMGPVLGSFILIPMAEYLRTYLPSIQGLHLVVFGIILMIIASAWPEGIIGSLYKLRSKIM